MQVVKQTLPKNTIKLTVTLTPQEIKTSQEKVWADILANADIDGFRKGKAPLELVKQKTDARKVNAEIMGDLVRTYYPKAVADQKLTPIISPQIELDDFKPEKDFTFTATTALQPEVKVGDYKKAIKDLYDKKLAETTKTTQKDGSAKDLHNGQDDQPDAEAHPHTHLTPNEIVGAVVSVSNAEISDLLINDEVDKMLSRLINQLQTLKLDTEGYLKSQNKTADELKAEYAKVAHNQILGDLALVEIVKQEGVKATDDEVAQTLDALGDTKLREQYEKDEFQKAYIRAIIAKNKVLWRLSSFDAEVESTGSAESTQKEEHAKN